MFKKLTLIILFVFFASKLSFASQWNMEDNGDKSLIIPERKGEIILDMPVTAATTGTTYRTLGFKITLYVGAVSIDSSGITTPYVPPENVYSAYVEHALNEGSIYKLYYYSDVNGKKSILSSILNANGIDERSVKYHEIVSQFEKGWVATFNSVMTVAVNGNPRGRVVNDDNGYITGFSGTYYETADGIIGAAPWDSQSNKDLKHHFDIHRIMPANAIDMKEIEVRNLEDKTAECGTLTTTYFPIYNKSDMDIRYCSVDVTIGGELYKSSLPTAVFIPAGGQRDIPIVWETPSTPKDIIITLTANAERTVDEANYANNTGSVLVSVTDPHYEEPEINNNNYKAWNEKTPHSTIRRYAELTVTAIVSPERMKSGYGFTAYVTANVSTNSASGVTSVKSVTAYFPDDNYSKGYELTQVSRNGLNTTWEFPVNAISKIGAKQWYVPVSFPDRTNYVVKFRAEGAGTPIGDMFSETTCEIYIEANMYEDDITHGN